MIIDFHTHVYPEKIAASVVGKLGAVAELLPQTDGTWSGLAEHMKKTGVDRSVLLPVATNPEKTSHLNDYVLQLRENSSFVVFGAIHPACSYWKEELRRLSENGVKGVKVHPPYQGIDFDDPAYLRLLSYAAELGLIVITHAGTDIGLPEAEHCRPEMIRNVLKSVGPMKLVLAHMGAWGCWDEMEEILAEYPWAYIDTAFSIGDIRCENASAHFMNREQLLRFIKQLGSSRILFGSDSPWDSQSTGIAEIRALPVPDTVKADILGENAVRLLEL